MVVNNITRNISNKAKIFFAANENLTFLYTIILLKAILKQSAVFRCKEGEPLEVLAEIFSANL